VALFNRRMAIFSRLSLLVSVAPQDVIAGDLIDSSNDLRFALSSASVAALLASCVCGVGMSYSGFRLRKEVRPSACGNVELPCGSWWRPTGGASRLGVFAYGAPASPVRRESAVALITALEHVGRRRALARE